MANAKLVYVKIPIFIMKVVILKQNIEMFNKKIVTPQKYLVTSKFN